MIHRRDNYSLAERNTFRMNVSCACFVEYDSPGDLAKLEPESLPKPLIHIGGGSNLLFTEDFPGTVLHSNIKFYNMAADTEEEVLVEIGAGVVFDDFCAWACDKGLWGAENLSGIPGETGAAAVQNIGAYGAEVKDLVAQVKCFDLQTGRIDTLNAAQCRYGYRDSAFKHAPLKGRLVVVSVLFRLSRTAGPNLSYKGLRDAFDSKVPANPGEVRAKVLDIRAGKLPDPAEIGSAGSFFKNPVVPMEVYERIVASQAGAGSQNMENGGNSCLTSAIRRVSERQQDVENIATAKAPAGKRSGGRSPLGVQGDNKKGTTPVVPHFDLPGGEVKIPAAWLIDQCGLKGAQEGGAAVYHKQPLVIVNASGSASPQDIIALETRIINTVRDRFGITLSPEVEHI